MAAKKKNKKKNKSSPAAYLIAASNIQGLFGLQLNVHSGVNMK